MALTQDQIAQQMLAQLRVLDPSVSGEIGTPERKVLDTVARAIAEAQVTGNLVTGALDVDSKFGQDLDTFVGMFGFGRQSGASAVGFVTFSRSSAATANITIPRGTQVQATVASSDLSATATVVFQTTTAVTLTPPNTAVVAPIQALVAGSQSNVAANTITQFANVGTPPLGITAVSNSVPVTNGADSESDAELKVRFRNTVFRNASGTEDQFTALAVATQFSTKANVIGPISRYKEYLQVPFLDDARTETAGMTVTITEPDGQVETVTAGHITVDEPDGTVETLIISSDGAGGGSAGQWTTTPSSNPYAKLIYTTLPYFASNGQTGVGTVFYRQDSDFTLNAPPLNTGDTHRAFGLAEIADPLTTPNNPNVTFFHIYTGTDTSVTMPRPGDVVLVEYAYLSVESRNDFQRNITNCVDVYVNGENPTTADVTMAPPTSSVNLFTTNPIDKFYNQNFRRLGLPDTPPTSGHIFTGLFWQPVIDLPSQIVVGTNTYLEGTHYWGVEDKTLIGNTVRSRNGIEWDPAANGMASGDPVGGPYTGQTIVSTGATSMTVAGYIYDRNIVDLQVALEASKQITTDVLAHRATQRYFKLDVTVVYSPGATASTVNATIQQALTTFFGGQYFGSTIQLSDLLVVIRNVTGVQNVRWSNDVAETTSLHRITECDATGNPRSGPLVFDGDFFLRDNELPALPTGSVTGDTLAGLIIRPRAENTFNFN